MSYIDGFIIAVPKAAIDQYKEHATLAGKVWMEHGALAYVETIGDNVPHGELTSFPRAVMAKDDEVVVFSWVVYRNREDRDAILKKVFEDERIKPQMSQMVFDGKRMIYGGFEPFLEL